ncbi:MAG: tryptophan synthase subunit alpha [Deltaproteobacteria bacterium]|nr:tryptophan synthase subunit alpha [Deltaproteobacteria bacterium]
MGRIADTFKELRKKGAKGLVTFITAGDPDLETTAGIIRELEAAGADFVELGVPFSDPMADGPTIQLSSERALASGTTLPKILEMVRSVRTYTQIPLILMGYYNPVLSYGTQRFVDDAVESGVDGVILVDLPPEEAETEGFSAMARERGLDVIFLLAPTSDEGRVAKVVKSGRGFLYYVSVTGVTGARTEVSASLDVEVGRIRGATGLPLVVGFGISDPLQAGTVALLGDGAVVGSALVKLFEQYRGTELKERVRDFVSALKAGITSAASGE